jgi:hypothetical protein
LCLRRGRVPPRSVSRRSGSRRYRCQSPRAPEAPCFSARNPALGADISCAQPGATKGRRQRVRAKTGRTSVIAKRTVSPKSSAERVGPKSAVKRVGPKSSSKRVGAKSSSKKVGPKRSGVKADGLSKFQRFRCRQARKGMKLLRIWFRIRRAPSSPPKPSGRPSICVGGRRKRRLCGSPRRRSQTSTRIVPVADNFDLAAG